MTDQQERYVFISYVRENQELVDLLCQDLERHGVKVWLDRNDIKPGARWKDSIRQAIRHGNFFIACFSDEYTAKTKTYMNEELTLAIEELRQYASDREWFIPVLLSECDVPVRSIGAGKTLLDINRITLYENWNVGIKKILALIKPIPMRIQNLISALRSEDKLVRKRAINALSKTSEPSVVPDLIEALKDKDKDVRDHAAVALMEMGQAAMPDLIEALKDQNENVHDNAMVALRKIGQAAVPDLIEALKDQNENVRRHSMLVLGLIGPEAKAALPALIEALEDQNENVRDQAMLAIGEIGQALLLDLIEALKDKDKDVRAQSLLVLGLIGPEAKAAVPALIETLRDENVVVRAMAAAALATIDTPEAQKAFEEYTKKSN